jgi:ubiquinone/menaquinone biosynthesis C-methylase UbiE
MSPKMLSTGRSRFALAGAVAAAGAAAWWLGDKAPYPYAQRRILDLPLPYLTAARLDDVLRPAPGERILDVGPGTGLQALHVAPQLGPDGRLDVLDIQQEMLDHVMRRAGREQQRNLVPTCSDACEMPFEDDSFDAVYFVTSLGEIPEPRRALNEAARVLAPGGRLVVGEFFDRHWITFHRLRGLTREAGFRLEDWTGAPFAYLARFGG